MVDDHFKIPRLVAKIVLSIPFEIAVVWCRIEVVEEGHSIEVLLVRYRSYVSVYLWLFAAESVLFFDMGCSITLVQGSCRWG